jgi:hypothetical protein
MSRQFWNETLTWAVANGVAVANTTTETILFPSVTIPANFLQDGRVLRLTAQGNSLISLLLLELLPLL